MYKPKKHIRLSSLFQAPKLGDIRTLFSEGTKAKGCTVELPWVNKRTGVNYSLTRSCYDPSPSGEAGGTSSMRGSNDSTRTMRSPSAILKRVCTGSP